MKGKLFILSGYSGTGKNAIINKVKVLCPNSFKYIPSYTTRSMRTYNGETQGNPYFFVSKEVFFDKVANKEFIEYNEVHNKFYGTPIKEYQETLSEGYTIIKDIDVEGALKLKSLFQDDVVLVFIEPPSIEELIKRLKCRGEEDSQIELRLSRVEFEKSFKPHFDYFIVNETLDEAVKEFMGVIKGYVKEWGNT